MGGLFYLGIFGIAYLMTGGNPPLAAFYCVIPFLAEYLVRRWRTKRGKEGLAIPFIVGGLAFAGQFAVGQTIMAYNERHEAQRQRTEADRQASLNATMPSLHEHKFCPYSIEFIGKPNGGRGETTDSIDVDQFKDGILMASLCKTARFNSIEQVAKVAADVMKFGGIASPQIERYDSYVIAKATFTDSDHTAEVRGFFTFTGYQYILATRHISVEDRNKLSENFLSNSKKFGKPFNSKPFIDRIRLTN